ncbi:alpha/beta fold hydrolase [Novosphingobium beihaiensis]|uniref:Alpha/beta fold hydrolase n=1 Tax=Novosphingobium beihaiensis TaxID=2930389 RepID=A0ABT0BMV2_9SPHN|nr:alpha/beta fold hydrolase [Novosphingobium beihaiensis]MCJ2186381.1 alpha/beta fold hydrolase [Novosphingobium beihaiensis]
MNRIGWLLLPLLCLLGGCGGLKLPNPQLYAEACPPVRNGGPEMAGDNLFFVSMALRDCRKGVLDYAGFRERDTTYGQAVHQAPLTRGAREFATGQFTHAAWLDLLSKRVNAPGNGGRLLVFIHGYNNDFDEALDAAWKVSRLYYAGVPAVVLRWPSRAKVQGYVADEDSVVWAQAEMNRTLTELASISPQVTVVAHSMGSRAAIAGIEHLNQAFPGLAGHVRRVVLASPDFDRDTAMREGGALDRLLAFDRKVVIYASRKDDPLKLSRVAHGYARLGSSNCTYDVSYARQQLGDDGWCHLTRPNPDLAIVETSLAASDGLRHSDYIDSCAVRVDLAAFLRGEDPGKFRRKLTGENGTVGYQIDPDLVAASGLCPDGGD